MLVGPHGMRVVRRVISWTSPDVTVVTKAAHASRVFEQWRQTTATPTQLHPS